MTDDVLSVLFQQCVPSFRCIRRASADRSLDQIPGIAIRASRCVPNSQRCRSAGQNGSNLIRDAPTGHSGQGKLGWLCFEEGLAHDRLIYLTPSRFMTSLTSNHSIICAPRVRWFTRGGICMVPTRRRMNGKWYGLYRPLSSARIASFSSSRGASSFLSTRSNCPNQSAHATEQVVFITNLVHEQEEVSITRV